MAEVSFLPSANTRKGASASRETGFHLELVFVASLSEVENGVKPCRIRKTLWSIQTQLICCIEDFKVFAGNWTLVLCELFVKEINPCRARSFSDGARASFAGLNTNDPE